MLTEESLRARITQLTKRATEFKGNERKLFSSGRLFELYGAFMSIWKDCEQIVWESDLDDRMRMALMDIQEDVYTHFLLSSLGYLPLHVEKGGAESQERARAVDMVNRMLEFGDRYPHLSGTLETYGAMAKRCYNVEE